MSKRRAQILLSLFDENGHNFRLFQVAIRQKNHRVLLQNSHQSQCCWGLSFEKALGVLYITQTSVSTSASSPQIPPCQFSRYPADTRGFHAATLGLPSFFARFAVFSCITFIFSVSCGYTGLTRESAIIFGSHKLAIAVQLVVHRDKS